jgi:hypothetical protein
MKYRFDWQQITKKQKYEHGCSADHNGVVLDIGPLYRQDGTGQEE